MTFSNHKYKKGDLVMFYQRTAIVEELGYTCVSGLDVKPSYTLRTVGGCIHVLEHTIDGYASDFRKDTKTEDGKITKLEFNDFCSDAYWERGFIGAERAISEVLLPKINEIIDKLNEREE